MSLSWQPGIVQARITKADPIPFPFLILPVLFACEHMLCELTSFNQARTGLTLKRYQIMLNQLMQLILPCTLLDGNTGHKNSNNTRPPGGLRSQCQAS